MGTARKKYVGQRPREMWVQFNSTQLIELIIVSQSKKNKKLDSAWQ